MQVRFLSLYCYPESPYKMNSFHNLSPRHETELIVENGNRPPHFNLYDPLPNFYNVTRQLDARIISTILNITLFLCNEITILQ